MTKEAARRIVVQRAIGDTVVYLNRESTVLSDVIAALHEIIAEANFTEDDGAMELGERLLRISDMAQSALPIPCATCGRYDMLLHENLQCPECKAESLEGIHTHPDMDK